MSASPGLSFVLCALAAACCEEHGDLPDPQRSHVAEVRSDCRSWLAARVTDDSVLKAVAALDVAEVSDLTALGRRLEDLGVAAAPAASLRWRRIAERRGEEPLPEVEVVREFLLAARELVEDG